MPGDYRQNYKYGGTLPPGGARAAYAATDSAGNQVVVKVVAARDPAAFLQQIQVAGGIVHPNVARVLDWGMDGPLCYVVSERVPGADIASLAGGRAFDERTVANIAEQAATGLAAIHQHGLVHGGIEPQNLVQTPDGAVKILDLGVRAATGPAAPGAAAGATYPGTTGPPAGLPGAGPYTSPEEAAGYAPTPASDQYSLGAVLYELASGRRPHQDAGGITPLRTLVPDLPFALEGAIMRALEPNPGNRFASMGQMRLEIGRAHDDARGRDLFESPPEVHAQPRRAWPWIVVAIVVLAAIGAGTAYALGVFSGSPTTPDLVGKTLADAKTALSGAGLTLGTVGYVQGVDAETPDLRVAEQDPAAGAGIAEGGKVNVTLGAGEATVPNVLGLTQAEASAALEEAGLSIATVQSTPSGSVPKGQVTSQVPGAGTKVKSGSQVTLTVSAGSETPTVPDVTDKTETAATKALNKAGFNVKVAKAASDTVPAGTVISQEPTAGVKANEGSTVTITVSTGATASPTAGPTSTPTGSPTSSPSP